MKTVFRVCLSVYIFVCHNLHAILDGLTSPIVLDTPYTFTNFEWARGFVKFNAGFDIPAGGTIFMGSNQHIGGSVNFNGGTMIMEQDTEFAYRATLSGPGYIKTNSYSLFFNSQTAINEIFYFQNELKIGGRGTSRISFGIGGAFNFERSPLILFNNIDFNINNADFNFYFPPGGVTRFAIGGVNFNIESFATLTITATTFDIGHDCSFSGFNARLYSPQDVRVQGDLTMNRRTTLIAKSVTVLNRTSELFFNAANLDIRNTSTSVVEFGGVGSVILNSICRFRSAEDNIIKMNDNMYLVFESGARLEVDPGTHFIIQ